ncbi:MAG: tyrosine-type recombinase/integrase [Lachnospiraceae bacterium]|nr:tyrosine-type recombinase/integrase [Lachnospiraceae bacterium]
MKKQDLNTEQLIEEFIHYLKRKNLAQNTISSYAYGPRLFFESYEEPTLENLRAFRELLIKEYLPASANQRIHSLNHFLLFLDERYPEVFPDINHYRLNTVKLPRNSFQDLVISNADCRKLQRRLKRDGHDFWYFVVRFLVTTGVRVSELTQIKVEHLTCGYLDLYSKGGKIRRIYITDSLCEEALVWCKNRKRTSGFLFSSRNGRPVTARGIQYQLKHFAYQYGLNPDTVYPHSFRHRFAKNFLHRCGDIALLADLLGHESIETTRIYLTRSSKEQQLLLDEIVTW